LFRQGVLAQYLDDKRSEPIPNEVARVDALRSWVSSLGGRRGGLELSLEQAFTQAVLVNVLGYTVYPSPTATIYPKPPAALTEASGTPDAVLGAFPEGQSARLDAVLELKGPGTPLDAPQARENHETPVEQAFGYGESILGVRWVLVSNMAEIRLYSVESRDSYESFALADCVRDEGAFRRLYFLLHHNYLVADAGGSPVTALLRKSASAQAQIRASFYATYYRIRADLLEAVGAATIGFTPAPSRDQLLTSVQRLLDRMLFLFYCEDHPDQLIPAHTVKSLTENARRMPGPSSHKVYDALKYLFREVDVGSPPASGLSLNAYNGELFKDDPIIDHIDLPDALHDTVYRLDDETLLRPVQGVWGLHVYDFWQELNEHLLGHIFEESLSDLVTLRTSVPVTLAQKLAERRRHGIFYTDQILSDFLVTSAVRRTLGEVAASSGSQGGRDLLDRRLATLSALRIVDFACGSGAFLVSALRALLSEFWRTRDAIEATEGPVVLPRPSGHLR
jgi:hypothetical protein